ncbi:MAG: 3'(2'),5'-bisphosphate nucleotidase CysQ [Balneolaceae bacterium]|nr:3'(2'),5'-bisphosphate nucleotidase CysQ [Balneolaceae bacterium]MCH8549464.1 3'(2'),5'-bisphosphate nucleotidase CysQ [Balneolaceae bacterium]
MNIDTQQIINIAKSAGEAILEYYQEANEVGRKSDDSPLTKADLAAHHVIVEGLNKLTPEIPVISEEGGVPVYDERKKWERFWLVDPLDGTKEFIKKNGEFTVNIALIDNFRPIIGVVYVPVTGIGYIGSAEYGSRKVERDGSSKPIKSTVPDVSQPLKVVVSRSHGSDDSEEELLKREITIGEKIVAGSSLKFCMVAEGEADIYPRMGPTMEWDTAAGDAIFRYSGQNGERYSSLTYNKRTLKNDGFIIGL